MYYCDKCGEKINDITKPCPTCGMYLNNNYNYQSQNNATKSYSKNNIKRNIFIIGIIAIVLIFVFINFNYASSTSTFNGNGYYVEYLDSVWSEVKNDNDYFTLEYKTGDDYLVFPNEIINYSIDINNEDVRNNLYTTYQLLFNNSSNIFYYNIMSEIKRIDNSEMYYLSTDFYNRFDESYRGRTYFLHTSDGKCLTFVLLTSDTQLRSIEKDIFELFKNIEV